MPIVFHHEHKYYASQTPAQYAAVLVPFNKVITGNIVLLIALKNNNYIATYHTQKEQCMSSLLEAAKKKSCSEKDEIHLFYLTDSDKITTVKPLNSTFLIFLISNGKFVSEETLQYPCSHIDKISFDQLSKQFQEQKHAIPPLTRKTTLLITKTLGFSPTSPEPKAKPETPVTTSPIKVTESVEEATKQPMPDLSSLAISKRALR